VFRGHYRHTIDPKGRLSIPAKFRDELAEGSEDRLVVVPTAHSLDVHPGRSWDELEARVAALPRLDPDARRFRYAYLSLGQDVLLDPHGRIQISADYRERAGLAKDVVIIGMGEAFEVWDAQRWAQFEREMIGGGAQEELRGRLALKGV
jgi:transcriptional regulator MraZ